MLRENVHGQGPEETRRNHLRVLSQWSPTGTCLILPASNHNTLEVFSTREIRELYSGCFIVDSSYGYLLLCLAVHQNFSLSEGKQEFSINHIVQIVEAQ